MTYAQDERLSYIDWRLTTLGEIRREHLMRQFRLSISQASADLNEFIRRHPDAMTYDRSAKLYRAVNGYRTRCAWSEAAIALMAALAVIDHPLAWR